MSIPTNPTEPEVERIKENIIKEFSDVLNDGQGSLKKMHCKPSVIELLPDTKPIRLSTAGNMAYGYREADKEELDKMKMGNKA